MAYTGKIIGLGKDYATNKYNLSLSVNEDARGLYEKYKDCDKLSIKIEKYRDKRSLAANNYFWQLTDKMAKILHTTKDELYLQQLKKYGVFEYILCTEKAYEGLVKKWRLIERMNEIDVNGKDAVQARCYFGSSTYNSKEMADLINGTVDDAKELGIETETPEEIAKMIRDLEKHEKRAATRK